MGIIDSAIIAFNNGLTSVFNFSYTSLGGPPWARPDNPADAFAGSMESVHSWLTMWDFS